MCFFSYHRGVNKTNNLRCNTSYIIFVKFVRIRNCAAEKATASLGFFLFVFLPRHDKNVSAP